MAHSGEVDTSINSGDSAGSGRWDDQYIILRRLAQSKLALGGTIYVALFVIIGIIAPLITPHDPMAQNYDALNQAPSLAHPFGTDNYGRDVFSRVLYGTRYALLLGIVIIGIQMIIGVGLGLIAGYYEGYVETVIMRIVDISLSIPGIVLALAIAGMLGGGLLPLIVAISLVGWRGFTRIVRGDVKSVIEEDYIEAARSSGVPDRWIILKHILPNVSSSIIVYATLTMPTVILWSAALSFLGMGVHPPTPEWGALIADGRGDLQSAWWISTFPGFAIMATIIAFNAIGDGLRDALDPKQAR
ncbi:ABC-type transport system permease protein (probable substrate dipeptide/oligopeptide) (plasmid) [Natrialba magadii ATCC 43099]|uniref:ABC-type transport system permease protein (Probable substrate dipeptide/oligopeptide) n=1 Tax=Natrialba magadii (strain ATCC 43099 / DSM 3394 / CCM 3739 / CIP 104546 / IAM 13178 / JCM 8861 / NBRC 102185 / NCIMB 2190 / MS3) TaxID=547559 RepID=D3T1W6_NATMM|nr:ABC transporter permease [Natrialba magadii]ADD07575.1 ABC-type transport system permease protein (probable substrate dipeptide/oligopeptide) [Natrialba magadii ATCC 43099]ELY27215.1 binding-protein-dependent transport system inner membrane protein [Natrialba magadii ATCC 43099]